MTEREIEAFLTIVRTGSISAAAEVLYVTQPALSRRIRALEQELGYQLFIRKKGLRNVGLTAEGKAFISLAERWKTVWNESRALKDMDRSGVFHIGSVGSVGTYLMPMVLERFMEKNPDIDVELLDIQSDEYNNKLTINAIPLRVISMWRMAAWTWLLYRMTCFPRTSLRSRLLRGRWFWRYPVCWRILPGSRKECCPPRALTRKRKSACPGTRNMTHGTITGSAWG